jgi:hypothetical protein
MADGVWGCLGLATRAGEPKAAASGQGPDWDQAEQTSFRHRELVSAFNIGWPGQDIKLGDGKDAQLAEHF